MATIHDVARMAQVSISTVSRALNGSAVVSEELNQRINEAMATLDYQPNQAARSLRMGRTRTIGLILPENTNPYFAEMLYAIEEIGFANDLSVIVCNSGRQFQKEKTYIDSLISKKVDGIIFVSAGESDNELKRLVRANIPFVTIDWNLPGIMTDTVMIDGHKGTCVAVNHLLSLGHRRIAFITPPETSVPSFSRVIGFQAAMDDAGVEVDPACSFHGDFSLQSGRKAADYFLTLDPIPTAILASNDMMAIGAIMELQTRGFSIPEDISIVGIDNISLAAELMPPLTTVDYRVREVAASVMDVLIHRMHELEQDTPQSRRLRSQFTIITPVLICRESTKQIIENPDEGGDGSHKRSESLSENV